MGGTSGLARCGLLAHLHFDCVSLGLRVLPLHWCEFCFCLATCYCFALYSSFQMTFSITNLEEKYILLDWKHKSFPRHFRRYIDSIGNTKKKEAENIKAPFGETLVVNLVLKTAVNYISSFRKFHIHPETSMIIISYNPTSANYNN